MSVSDGDTMISRHRRDSIRLLVGSLLQPGKPSAVAEAMSFDCGYIESAHA